MRPEDRTVVQLLAELRVDVPFGVETGKIAAQPDTGLQVRAALSPPAPNQNYFAQSGAVQLSITRDQMEALQTEGGAG